ncbi:MAG TPA: immunoglobulin domain-containing protein [Dongiaceae bacterium]|nr:immunoglobulin domain-containing protein [Dongiaceae bacterium]
MTTMTNRRLLHVFAVLGLLLLLPSCKQSDSGQADDRSSTRPPEEVGQETPPDPVFEPIQINTAPQDQFGFPGQTVTFTVAASSKIALHYQWYHDDTPIEGATTASLDLAIVDNDDAGTYRVDVSNASTSQSAAAELSIGALITITSQPQSVSVYPGDNASLSVSAAGTDVQYQWQSKATGSWKDIADASEKTLLISNVDVNKATQYRVKVGNEGGVTTSSAAAVTLKSPVAITQQPASKQAVAGQDTSFTSTAAGHGELSYRWYKGNYAIYDSNKYSGTGTATLTVKAVAATDASLYKVKVSNNDKKYAFSNGAQLSVAGPAIVTVQPVNTSLYSGQSGSLVIAASGDQPLRIQWQKWSGAAWQNLSGATGATLVFSAASSSNAGRYRCQVSNAAGQDFSAEATVTVLQGVSITSAPASKTVISGASASFSLVATGDNLQYEWTKNGTALSNTSSTLSFAAVKEVDQGTYGCRVYNNGGSQSCAAFTLTVQDALAITRQPVSQNTYEGGSATLSVEAQGEPAPTIQWYFKGQLVGTGANLVLNNITVSQQGDYQCVVKNAQASLNCNIVTVTVSQSVKITGQPANTTANEGASLSLTLSAVGESLNYDWSKNGTSLGINEPRLSFSSVKASDEGTYSCRIWNSNSSANCNSFNLTVNQGVKITTQPAAASAFEDGSVTLSVTATGKPAPTVDWYLGSTLVKSNSTSLALTNLTMAQAGSYQCVVKNSVNSVKCNAVNVTVREKVRITKQLANQSLNAGQSVALDFAVTGEAPITYKCYQGSSLAASGSSVASLVIANADTADSGSYYCTASNAGSSARTNTVSISVVDLVKTSSAQLSWTAPTTRANGQKLSADEIAGYEVYMSTSSAGPFTSVVTSDGNENGAVIEDLAPGIYYFGVTTLDIYGLESEMSALFKLTVQ